MFIFRIVFSEMIIAYFFVFSIFFKIKIPCIKYSYQSLINRVYISAQLRKILRFVTSQVVPYLR